ncbi:hypothetical protein CG481_022235 (plasmid) [Bacillus cytotoxicus]|uniref:hypothetical protein n=1 Tax=Bacillus cytotoxicus TaxID=580165 RepID=UPI000D6672A6|nr:hypothetical protein [Bacillus cytotoxicus]AWC39100.1 hypothetical protein CG481_022235 [Bacillus cytotoxicus]
MIYINQVLQYTVDFKRIRIIEMEEYYVFIVDIDAISSMPKKELYSNLIEEAQQGELLLISDPFAKVIIDSELSDLQIQKRDEGWSIIQHYCLGHMEALLQKGGREKKIKEIADESGTSSTKIKSYLAVIGSEV